MDALELWHRVREALARSPRPKHFQIAAELGVGRSRVSNLARLANLPSDVQDLIERGLLTPKHGEVLLALPSSAKQSSMATQTVERGHSVGRLRKEVKKPPGGRMQDDDPLSDDPDIAKVEKGLSELLGTTARFAHRKDGSGWLRIRYTDLSTLDGVLARLGYEA